MDPKGRPFQLALARAAGPVNHTHPIGRQPAQKRNLNPRTADAPVSGVLIGWPNGLLLQLPSKPF
eukprot:SAG25_NODE_1821_length_2292_cov_2.689922_1_plen_64_part_10